jgi:hypothetical protein
MRPRIILRDKHATVASLSVEAIVAMRSTLAEPAVAAALATPYSWFGEMVRDNLARLSERWRAKDRRAAEWCDKLLGENSGQGTGKLSASNASY